jgi:hypothetical protein
VRKDTLTRRFQALNRPAKLTITIPIQTLLRVDGIAKQQGISRREAVQEAVRDWAVARERSLNRQRRLELTKAMREAADQKPIAELLERFRAQMESVGEGESETGLQSAAESATVPNMESGNAVESEQISVIVPKDLADMIREKAADNDRTMAAELRRAIRAYFMPEAVS